MFRSIEINVRANAAFGPRLRMVLVQVLRFLSANTLYHGLLFWVKLRKMQSTGFARRVSNLSFSRVQAWKYGQLHLQIAGNGVAISSFFSPFSIWIKNCGEWERAVCCRGICRRSIKAADVWWEVISFQLIIQRSTRATSNYKSKWSYSQVEHDSGRGHGSQDGKLIGGTDPRDVAPGHFQI